MSRNTNQEAFDLLVQVVKLNLDPNMTYEEARDATLNAFAEHIQFDEASNIVSFNYDAMYEDPDWGHIRGFNSDKPIHDNIKAQFEQIRTRGNSSTTVQNTIELTQHAPTIIEHPYDQETQIAVESMQISLQNNSPATTSPATFTQRQHIPIQADDVSCFIIQCAHHMTKVFIKFSNIV